MSGREIAIVALLAAGAAVELLCCLGVWLMRGAYNRLHYLGPAGSIGPVFFGAAVIVHTPQIAIICKTLLIVLILMTSGPVLAHAIARAQYAQTGGQLREQSPEKQEEP